MAGNYSENSGIKSGHAPGPTIRLGNHFARIELRHQALIPPRPHVMENAMEKRSSAPKVCHHESEFRIFDNFMDSQSFHQVLDLEVAINRLLALCMFSNAVGTASIGEPSPLSINS